MQGQKVWAILYVPIASIASAPMAYGIVFFAKGLGEIRSELPRRGAKYRRSRLRSATFNQYLAISHKRC